MLRALEANRGRKFIFSDIDIQFFGKIETAVLEALDGHDIVFQQDDPQGMICTGFYACESNEKVNKLWSEVRRQLAARTHECGDQKIVNELLNDKLLVPAVLRSRNSKARNLSSTEGKKSADTLVKLESLVTRVQNKFGLSWTYFPSTFLSGGTLTGRAWSPGDNLDIPGELLIHHANWTIGVDNKIAQMKYVSDSYAARILPEWTPLSGILPREKAQPESGIPYEFNWCCGPVARLQLVCYREGTHLLVLECLNIQFENLQIEISGVDGRPFVFQLKKKENNRDEVDLLQMTVILKPGVHEFSLRFDQWKKATSDDPRTLAMILKDARLWDSAG